MADIAICKNHDCPSRLHCYRYRAKPHPYRQLYSEYKHEGERCDFYSSTKGWDEFQLVPIESLEWMKKGEVLSEKS